MKSSLRTTLTGLVFLGAGLLLGYALFSVKSPISKITGADELHGTAGNGDFPHISPLLICNNTENISNIALKNTKQLISAFIDQKKKEGNISEIGVYFRDINNGPWFGINQDKEFSPGSLLKVPLLISYYKYAQRDPSILTKEIEYGGGDAGALQFELPEQKIEAGKTYTIEALLKRMANFSDNNASLLLYEIIDKKHLEESYKDLGLEIPDPKVDYNISVHEYASFFRVLFNSTYLNNEYSEKALKLMTDSTFKKGLAAGVPDGIEIAHKFGERTYANDPSTKQLHDCGIIYKPNQPYLLCVMTRGYDFMKLEDTIKNISEIVYHNVSK